MPDKSKRVMDEGDQKMSPDVVVIKKYANRRLYNTASSSYVTLEFLAQMVRERIDFVVYDAKTSEDITRAVLAQIIFEEEAKGQNLLPIGFLREMIRFYGQNVGGLLPTYLEQSMQMFVHNQEELSKALGTQHTFKTFEDMTRQNLQMIERAAQMFSPFSGMASQTQTSTSEDKKQTSDAGRGAPLNQFDLMQMQMQQLQDQINALTRMGQSMQTGQYKTDKKG